MNRAMSMPSALCLIPCLILALVASCKKHEQKPAPTAGSSAEVAPGSAAPAGAAGTPSAATPPTDMTGMTIAQACDTSLASMDAMGKAIESNKGNCDAMGDALQKWASDYRVFIEWNKALVKDEARKKEFEAACNPRIDAAMKTISPMMVGAATCGQHPKINAVWESLR